MADDEDAQLADPGTAPLNAHHENRRPAVLSRADAGGKAFQLGWLMAGLYGPLLDRPDRSGDHLPTLNELPSARRVPIAVGEAVELIHLLDGSLSAEGTSAVNLEGIRGTFRGDSFRSNVLTFHLDVLARLEANAPALADVYSLGRALCDTCWQVRDARSFERWLSNGRLDQLVRWLGRDQSNLPDLSGQAVAISLTSWQAWLHEFSGVRGGWETAAVDVETAIRRQGELWRSILSGEQSAQSLLTIDGYVDAATRALRRARKVLGRIVARFWLVIALITLAAGGIVALGFVYAKGTAKVWSTLGTVAAYLGVTGGSIRAGLHRLATAAGRPLWAIGEEEAVAAAITTLPTFDLGSLRRHRLRRQAGLTGAVAPTGRSQLFGDRTTRWRALMPPTRNKVRNRRAATSPAGPGDL